MKKPCNPADRRRFVKTTAAFTAGLGGFSLLPHSGCAMSEAKEGPNIIGPRKGYAPQIGTLVSMLDWMRSVVLGSVRNLTVEQLDYLHDSKSNTIGAMLLHLGAVERFYQLQTFEGQRWESWQDPSKRQLDIALNLGDEARQKIKNHSLDHYLSTLNEVRQTSLRELQKRDDNWLMAVDEGWSWGPTNNYCKWFHVCEHESNHNGQIKWVKNRLPGARGGND